MRLKSIHGLLKESFFHWLKYRAPRMGAALSFYAVFSIVPLLSLMVMIFGSLLSHAYVQNGIIEQARLLVGNQGAAFIQPITLSLGSTLFDGATVAAGISTFFIGTLGVFYELKNSLDDLWKVDSSSKKTRGWKYFFSARIISLSMIPILGILFLVSMVLSTLLSLAAGYLPALANTTLLLQIGTAACSFFILSFLFIFIYRFIPDKKLPWKESLRGALFTALFFMIGKILIGIYLTQFAPESAFGAAGAFIVFLLWIYYSAEIFLFGASFTYVYSKRYGRLRES